MLCSHFLSSFVKLGTITIATANYQGKGNHSPLLFPVHRNADMVTGLVFKKQKPIIPAIGV